jgi:hypothetical protein
MQDGSRSWLASHRASASRLVESKRHLPCASPDRPSPLLNPANAIGHDQHLTQRMGMPCRSRTGLERNPSPARPHWFFRVKRRLNTNRSRKTFRRACDEILCGGWRNRDPCAAILGDSSNWQSCRTQKRSAGRGNFFIVEKPQHNHRQDTHN